MIERSSPQQRVPLRIWAAKVDPDALRQLSILAKSELLAAPIAVMPDVHSAGDVCVGSVLATSDVVLPTAVGEDLGCGMSVELLPIAASSLSRAQLEEIVTRVLDIVPTGRRSHATPQPLDSPCLSTRALLHAAQFVGARHAGTLGGGNHFIELQRDAHDRLWTTVHSGSRGIGAAIAAHHGRVAMERSARRKLPFLPLESTEAAAFWQNLKWALAFAVDNRQRMQLSVRTIIARFCGQHCEPLERFDVAHNLIARELHGRRELIIHRKGAMPAAAGARGIIPGSMGTASYIVEGLGNPASYASCSHGAGRRLPRSEARRRISVAQLQREMGGVVLPRDPHLLRAMVEEAPSAYKPIKRVLEEQADLTRPVLRLEPLAVIKGG
jgi:tRNA-splicing ligase RtcB